MVKIPTFIKSKIADTNKYNIPKIIIQTYKNDNIHEKIYKNIKNIQAINPEYDYYLITDDIGRTLIEKNFEKDILDAYDKLNIGAAKGDFLRYISIYIYGGVYIDLDSSITTDLNKLIDNNMSHYFIWDADCNIMNTPLISQPKNPLVLNIIKEVARRITNYESNIFLATGPTVVTDVIYKDITNKSVYNTKLNVSNSDRKQLWIENVNYKHGKIIHSSKVPGIHFRMKGYTNRLLYSNHDKKYKVTVNSPTPYLYKYIQIGKSNLNSKTIELNKEYRPDTKLVFLHTYKDTFSYEFSDNKLTITRTDADEGWGQDLLAYL